MNESIKKIELLHGDLIDIVDDLQGTKTLLEIFYRDQVENPDIQVVPEERIRILSGPYSTVINHLGSVITNLDKIFNEMDEAIINFDASSSEDYE